MFYLDSLYTKPRCAGCDEPVDPDDLIWNENTVWGGMCPECLADLEEGCA